jgi:hypothetical protein
MPTPRLFRSLAAAAVAAGLVAAAWATPGQNPAKTDQPDPPDKKGEEQAKGLASNGVLITNLFDNDAICAPFNLEVKYVTREKGLEVAILFPGYVDPPKPAPPPGGKLIFTLDVPEDTTCVEVTAVLRVAGGGALKDADTRYCITLFKDCEKGPNLDPAGLGGGMRLAAKAATPGGAIPAGLHYGHFPPAAAKGDGYQARVWVQGRFAKGQLRTEYDLPADLLWFPSGGKWFPIWVLKAAEDLAAGPVPKGGEMPETIMRAVLLDRKGRVLRVMTHKYWE